MMQFAAPDFVFLHLASILGDGPAHRQNYSRGPDGFYGELPYQSHFEFNCGPAAFRKTPAAGS
jgi:hypothetical protein